jgi:hypothetical protein
VRARGGGERDIESVQLAHGGLGQIAAGPGFPFVVLLDEDDAGEAEESGRVREHADDVGSALDFLIHSF